VKKNKKKTQKKKTLARCAASTHRGIVVAFHEIGACPSHLADVSGRLAAACYDVYVPVLPGHGARCSPGGDCISREGGGVLITAGGACARAL
jgi:dienelactone hydrolase